jgi:hypothetical protein
MLSLLTILAREYVSTDEMAAIIEDFMGWSKKKPGSFEDPSTR